MCCSSAVNIVDLRSYGFQNLVVTHRCPIFVHAVCLPPLPLATFVRAACLPSTSSTCIRTRCKTSLVRTAVIHLYALLVSSQHRCPVFVRVAELGWYTPLSYIRTCCVSAAIAAGYIRTCCLSAVNIINLRSYALQNLVGTHCCPTFVHAACLPSTSSTWVRTRCRASFIPTAVLHSYALLVCRQHHRPAFARVVELRWYPLLSYIRTRCSSAVYIVDLRS